MGSCLGARRRVAWQPRWRGEETAKRLAWAINGKRSNRCDSNREALHRGVNAQYWEFEGESKECDQ